jgi:hypothetical protein
VSSNEQRRQKAEREFASKAKKIHGGKYDYSLVKYINCRTKVTIRCPTHGVFNQTPNNHLMGNGCPGCKTDVIKRTNNQRVAKDIKERSDNFVSISEKVHCRKYDYAHVNYVNAFTPVTIVCPNHGKFKQTPNNHMQGRGCIKCAIGALPGGYSVATFEERPDLKDRLGFLYVSEITDGNTTFIKIGITVQPPQYRLSRIKSAGLQYNILKIREYSLYQAFLTEQKIIQELSDSRFYPNTKFEGYTECFRRDSISRILQMLL